MGLSGGPKRGSEKCTKNFLNSLGGFWYKQRVSKTEVFDTLLSPLFRKRFYAQGVVSKPVSKSKLGLLGNRASGIVGFGKSACYTQRRTLVL